MINIKKYIEQKLANRKNDKDINISEVIFLSDAKDLKKNKIEYTYEYFFKLYIEQAFLNSDNPDDKIFYKKINNNKYQQETMEHVLKVILFSLIDDVSEGLLSQINIEKNNLNIITKKKLEEYIKQWLFTIEIINQFNSKGEISDINEKETILSRLKILLEKMDNEPLIQDIIDEQCKTGFVGSDSILDLYKAKIININILKDSKIKFEKLYSELFSNEIISKEEYSYCIDCDELIKAFLEDKEKNKKYIQLSNFVLLELLKDDKLNLEDLVNLRINIRSLLEDNLPFEQIVKLYGQAKDIKKGSKVRDVLLNQNEYIDLFRTRKLTLDTMLQIKDFISLNTFATILNEENFENYRKEVEQIFTPEKIKRLYENGHMTEEIIRFYHKIKTNESEQKLYNLFKENKNFQKENLIELFKKQLISLNVLLESFDIQYLYKNEIITLEELGMLYNDDKIDPIDFLLYINESEKDSIRLWDKGIISTKKLNDLEIKELNQKIIIESLEDEFTGKSFGSLAQTLKEKETFKIEILSLFNYGILKKSVKPIVLAYENEIISNEEIKDLMRKKLIVEDEILEMAEKGILTGKRLAQLRYCKENFISKENYNFLKSKYPDLISREDEDYAINNMTAQEQLEELKKNGWSGVNQVTISEILENENFSNGKQTKEKRNNVVKCQKSIVIPYIRYELLKNLNISKILVTPKDGFKGYQVMLIPSLGVAVFERLFKENKSGEIEAVYGEATYVCKISDCISTASKSKSEIIDFMDGNDNCEVDRFYHSKNWIEKLLESIQKVNPNVTVKKNKNNKIEQILVNGKKVIELEKIEILNQLNDKMKNGEYSKSIE